MAAQLPFPASHRGLKPPGGLCEKKPSHRVEFSCSACSEETAEVIWTKLSLPEIESFFDYQQWPFFMCSLVEGITISFQLSSRACVWWFPWLPLGKVTQLHSWLPTPHPRCSRFLCTGSCTVCLCFFSCSMGLSTGLGTRLCKDATTGTSVGVWEGGGIATNRMAAPSTTWQLVLHPVLTRRSCLPSYLCRGGKFGLIYDRICQM